MKKNVAEMFCRIVYRIGPVQFPSFEWSALSTIVLSRLIQSYLLCADRCRVTPGIGLLPRTGKVVTANCGMLHRRVKTAGVLQRFNRLTYP